MHPLHCAPTDVHCEPANYMFPTAFPPENRGLLYGLLSVALENNL